MRIDHVTLAGPDLRRLEAAFAAAGMRFEYGGAHSNGVTHMSLLGFADGSYIELVSSMKPGERSPWWHAHIRGGAGPCAWCIVADDVGEEAKRIAAMGMTVRGPIHMQRQRPDGRTVEWDLAFLGEGEAGATLPFIIKDRTPREWRVRPNTEFAQGVDTVVLAVERVDEAVKLFAQVYGLEEPQREHHAHLDCDVHAYRDAPLALAAPPDDPHHWLSHRLNTFGPCPCAFLLKRAQVDAPDKWFGRDVHWLDAEVLLGSHVGLVATCNNRPIAAW